MDNHYHLLVETPDGNLSHGMRQLNGAFTQRFNRNHSRVSHIFQGHYKAIIIQRNTYLLGLARYIVLNPVRARMVHVARDWPWSSYQATCGVAASPTWLDTGWVLSTFAKRRKIPKPLNYFSGKINDRNAGIVAAYQSGGYNMKEVGEYFGVHYSSVGKIIKQTTNSQFKT